MNKKEEFKELIKKSFLNNVEKEMWFSFISVVSNEQIIPLLEFLTDDFAKNLEIITDNLRQKIKLASGDNSKNAQDIINKELMMMEEN